MDEPRSPHDERIVALKQNERPLSGPSNTTRVTCINSFRQRRFGLTQLRFRRLFINSVYADLSKK